MRRLLLLALLLSASPATAAHETYTVALGGDVMFGRVTADGYAPYAAPELDRWGEVLRGADIAFVNLETSICDQGRTSSKLPLLWAPAARLTELKSAGIDIVSVANNHVLDCGRSGLTRTTRALNRAGMSHVGVRGHGARLVGDDLVVIAATMHPPPYHSDGPRPVAHVRDDEDLPDEVQRLRRVYPGRAIMVSLHWGKERSKRIAAWQRSLAHRLVAHGATIIAGHGPHTEQEIEQRGDALVFYSLGNLAFDDASPIGRPVGPQLVELSHNGERWGARLAALADSAQ